ncbi:MAG: hypothetical protein NUV73_03750 [Candidatus Daviesbacteria bacterium]|nr:hypothetical protein [Candidatus Daviesbacteria bacterium]
MIATTELQEKFYQPTRINLLEYKGGYLPSEIEIPAEQLGFQKWNSILEQTQSDGRERLIVVSSIKGRIEISKVSVGFSDIDSKAESVSPPFLPQGLLSFLPWTRNLAYVHSHQKPAVLSHLKTTLLSDKDVRTYHDSTYPAEVMIDPGGVHVLLRTSNLASGQSLPDFNLHEAALGRAKKGNNTVLEAMSALGDLLASSGIRYYYSPQLTPTPEGQISLTDVRSIK